MQNKIGSKKFLVLVLSGVRGMTYCIFYFHTPDTPLFPMLCMVPFHRIIINLILLVIYYIINELSVLKNGDNDEIIVV